MSRRPRDADRKAIVDIPFNYIAAYTYQPGLRGKKTSAGT